jgi:molybdopterin-synthase adenylyltransferase
VFRHVLVAGIGALGSELVKNLGLLDCESAFLADPDVLEEKNITRSFLFREGVVGESKISQVLQRLETLFPRTRWNGAAVEIADVNAEQFRQADVLFSCVDSDLARTEIAVLGSRYKLPVCDAGLGGTSTRKGRVSWFPCIESAACFACLLSNKRRAELLSLWESDVQPCWAVDQPEQPAWSSTPTTTSIVAGLQAEIALASVRTATNSFSLHIDLDQTPFSQAIQHARSVACPFHDQVTGSLFPVCTFAECSACRTEFCPYRRIAWVRRRGTCPSCGSRALIIRGSSRTNHSHELVGSA